MSDDFSVEALNTPEDYCQVVENGLRYWLAVHTDPVEWAAGWAEDGDNWQPLLAERQSERSHELGLIENDYWSFNLKAAVIDAWVVDFQHWYERCPECGCIDENGTWDTCNCEPDEDGGYPERVTPTLGELADWCRDYDPITEYPDSLIQAAMEGPGFETYSEAMESTLAPVIEEIKEVLESIEAAQTPADRLQACMWGTRVAHVNGNVFQDYAQHICWNGWDKAVAIRDHGLESVFSSEQVRAFLEDRELEDESD